MNEEERKQKARENAKRYYQKNKEKVLKKQKEYVKKKYATDENFREKIKEKNRKYASNNKEKVRELKRNWARKHYKELREKGLMKPSKSEIINNLQSKIDKANEILNRPQFEYDNIHCNYEEDIKELKDILKEDK